MVYVTELSIATTKRVDTHKGDVITHTVIWKLGPDTLGFLQVDLE